MGVTREEFLSILNKWVEGRNEEFSNKAEIVEEENYVYVYAYEMSKIYDNNHLVVGQEKRYSRLMCFASDVFLLAKSFGVDAYISSIHYTADDKKDIPFIMLAI